MVRTTPASLGGFIPPADVVIVADISSILARSSSRREPRAIALIEHKGIRVHTVPDVAPIQGRGGPRCSMRPLFRSMSMLRSAVSLVSALCLMALAGLPAGSKEALTPPPAVMAAIAAAPAPDGPAKVIVGAYINDIQALDFKANNYVVDFYVWFRWRAPDLHPSKTMEFMNRYASGDNIREELYEKPQEMPDGSLYSIIRYQGRFATKFSLDKYPFDSQLLIVLMEDSLSPIQQQVFVPDGERPVMLDPVITLPGFTIGEPSMSIAANTYPTTFGHLADSGAETYSRIVVTVPVTRPILAMSLKTFMPIALIVACAALVFFVRPRYIEGRIGLGITALLTMVALQLTSGASLPDVDYLMLLDKIYLLAYLFIIIALARVVGTSWRADDLESEEATSRADRLWLGVLLAAFILANVAVTWSALAASAG